MFATGTGMFLNVKGAAGEQGADIGTVSSGVGGAAADPEKVDDSVKSGRSLSSSGTEVVEGGAWAEAAGATATDGKISGNSDLDAGNSDLDAGAALGDGTWTGGVLPEAEVDGAAALGDGTWTEAEVDGAAPELVGASE